MALVLNGIAQYAEADFSWDQTADFSIAIKHKTVAYDASAGLVSAVSSTTSNGYFSGYFTAGTSQVAARERQIASGNFNALGADATDVEWNSLVVTYDSASDTITLYQDSLAGVSTTGSTATNAGGKLWAGALQDDSGNPFVLFEGKVAVMRGWTRKLSAAEALDYNIAASIAEVDAITGGTGPDLISDGTGATLFGSPTFDADSPFAASTTPTITDIDGDESVYPGQSYIIQATDDIGATQGTVFWERLDGTDDVQHTVTNWDAGTDQITVTAVRGGHNYGSGLYQARVVLGDGTTEILFDNAGSGLTLEAQPNTFAVTAASPNTTDDASLWSGLVDTSTGDPVTVVDGDQAWVKTLLDGLAIDSTGAISANETGSFTVQFWRASEGVWGSDQTVSFTLPAEAIDNWPFGKAINPIATKNWTWGSRHPMTGMRVRIFK